MIKAVIFDVDGVILNNYTQVINAFQSTAKELGFRVPSEHEIRVKFGQPWWVLLEKLFGKEPDKLARETYLRIWRGLESEMCLTEGVEKILPKIKIPLGLVTGKQMETLKRQVGPLLKNFSVIVTADDQTPGKYKPDPEPILIACKKIKVDPKDSVYIGDTMSDFKAATMAGTKFIAFLGGGATLEEFKKAGVKKIATTMVELDEMIKAL